MPATPLGFPYFVGSDVPAGHDQQRQLAEAIDDYLAARANLAEGGTAPVTSDADGFFTISHGLGVAPTWALVNTINSSLPERFGKVQVVGISATIISCLLVRTDTALPFALQLVTVTWVAGVNPP